MKPELVRARQPRPCAIVLVRISKPDAVTSGYKGDRAAVISY